MLDIRPVPFDHTDSARLIDALQQVYVERYGDGDETKVDAREFDPPHGAFLVAYLGEEAVACGGWRARDGEVDDPTLRDGDAEIKRMYVADAHRRHGHARTLLAAVERSAAAAGRLRVVLETGLKQPEAMALYTATGYELVPNFGFYRHHVSSRCYAKSLNV